MSMRQTEYAGSWYPAGEDEARRQIAQLWADAPSVQTPGPLHGGIVPHAGWMFSGRLACWAIGLLARHARGSVMVVLGCHMAPQSPEWIMGEGAWDTPLGPIATDGEAAADLGKLLGIRVMPPETAPCDNTIELQLPFVRYFFPDIAVVPMALAPRQGAIEAGRRIGEYLAAREGGGLVLGSTDLTHYGPNYGFAPVGLGKGAVRWVREQNDRTFISRVLALDPEGALAVGSADRSACCPAAAGAALAAGLAMGARAAIEVAYATSYDTQPGASFVGYAGIVF